MTDNIEKTKRMIEVMQAYVDGAPIEFAIGNGGGYRDQTKPTWNWFSYNYRVAETPDSIDWGHIDKKFNYVARDASGTVWAYSHKPYHGETCWSCLTEEAVERRIDNLIVSYKQGTVPWHKSLVFRPGFEE